MDHEDLVAALTLIMGFTASRCALLGVSLLTDAEILGDVTTKLTRGGSLTDEDITRLSRLEASLIGAATDLARLVEEHRLRTGGTPNEFTEH